MKDDSKTVTSRTNRARVWPDHRPASDRPLYGLKMFRWRRSLFGRFHRAAPVAYIARQAWKIYSAWMNHDFNLSRNGEAWIANFLARDPDVGPAPIFFDVGANEGEWTYLAARRNPQLTVHVFEISPDTYAALSENLSTLANVRLNQVGLYKEEGEIEIFANRSPDMTSVFRHPDWQGEALCKVPVMRGDAYMAREGLSHIHFLKIDVEGAEAEVLAGFEQALADGRVDVIQFEYNEFSIALRRLLRDYYDLLSEFKIGRLFPNFVDFRAYETSMDDFAPSNYIAVRKDLPGLIERLRRGS